MPELRDATVIIGVPGLNGGGVTNGQLTDAIAGLAPGNATYITQTANGTLTAEQALSSLSTGLLKVTTGTGVLSTAVAADLPAHTSTGVVVGASFLIDGGGAAITSGVKGDLEFPFACTITRGRLFADQSGTIAVSLWKDSYANYPPVVGDLLATWTISAATKYDSGVAGLSVAAGDIIRFNVNALATSITRVTVSMTLTREV